MPQNEIRECRYTALMLSISYTGSFPDIISHTTTTKSSFSAVTVSLLIMFPAIMALTHYLPPEENIARREGAPLRDAVGR